MRGAAVYISIIYQYNLARFKILLIKYLIKVCTRDALKICTGANGLNIFFFLFNDGIGLCARPYQIVGYRRCAGGA